MKCESCGRNGTTETHHITSKTFGGTNQKSNLAELCPNCHSDVHFGKIIIEGKFRTTNGVQLIYHKINEKPILENIDFPKVFVYLIKK